MPNWCMNTVTITGDATKLQALYDAAKEGELLEHMVPIGEWDYGTAVEAWGTKWDVSQCSADFIGDELTLSFDTAWGPPTTAYTTYTDANDDMHIEASYYEPGMCFVGEYDSGLGTDNSFEIDYENEDWADDIPQNLIDEWGLDSEYEQWLEWQEEETQ